MSKINLKDIRKILQNNGINTTGLSSQSLKYKFEQYNGKSPTRKVYKDIKQLGIKGKDGRVFLVKTKNGKSFAKKQFRSNKSTKDMLREITLQKEAAKADIAPMIKEFDLNSKFIIMTLLEDSLYAIMKKKHGKLTKKYQKDILRIFSNLDKIGIFHKDPNPLNFLVDTSRKLFIIDFGFAERIVPEKHGKQPNRNQMTLGLLIKFKILFPNCEYPVLKNSLPQPLQQILDKN
jgi:tRNA A-37 threonylcarbamoyl transferase component Bud32